MKAKLMAVVMTRITQQWKDEINRVESEKYLMEIDNQQSHWLSNHSYPENI